MFKTNAFIYIYIGFIKTFVNSFFQKDVNCQSKTNTLRFFKTLK